MTPDEPNPLAVMMSPMHTRPDAWWWRLVLAAVGLVTVVAGLLTVPQTALAATSPVAETRVGASTVPDPAPVGLATCVVACQGRVHAPPDAETAVGSCVAVDAVPEAVEGGGRVFVGTPRGTIYDIPEGWAPRVADNGKGLVYQRPGAEGNADMIRIMEPTSGYPDGYARIYNSGGQPVDVFGKPGPASTTHIPETYRGPWPGWPR